MNVSTGTSQVDAGEANRALVMQFFDALSENDRADLGNESLVDRYLGRRSQP